jgi:hypothetical protein
VVYREPLRKSGWAHRGARLHALFHGLFEPSEAKLVREVFDRASFLFERCGVATPEDRQQLIGRLAVHIYTEIEGVSESFDLPEVLAIVSAIFDENSLFLLPEIDWTERCQTSAYWELRDQLQVQRKQAEQFEAVFEAVRVAIASAFYMVAEATPVHSAGRGHTATDISVPSPKLDQVSPLAEVIESIIVSFLNADKLELGIIKRTRERLEYNAVDASGYNPKDPTSYKKPFRPPTKSDISNRRDLVEAYLGGTPLTRLFAGSVNFTIPEAVRFEHQHIIAGTGHGKSQTLQYLIANDLKVIAKGQASAIVIDSQGDLINTIASLKEFAPGHPLFERVVIIDPSDVEYPVSLNLFDVGIERLQSYPMLERERLTNSILELYEFVLGSLLDAGMTQKQNVIFRYVTRLMLHIPDATIHTLRELMEPGGEIRFAGSIAKLTGTARHFFETEFSSKEFEQTKRQVLRRLWGILENQTFERMFSHPRSKLDLFAEMNSGKLILINTAKDLLKETGTEIFGRFFIALIAQAAQERATLPESKRLPTFVYIDEAADYFDRNIGVILSQARKYNVGMVLAHQYLGQLDPKLQEAFAANTSIKFAGGVSAKDARGLAQMLNCEPALIENQKKGSFAVSVRGLTQSAISLSFPLGYVEKMERMTVTEQAYLKECMRERYAVHYSVLDREIGAGTKMPTAEQPDTKAAKPTGRKAKQSSPEENKDRPNTDPTPEW